MDWKLLTATAGFSVALGILATPAQAMSWPSNSLEEDVQWADAILVGRVLDREDLGPRAQEPPDTFGNRMAPMRIWNVTVEVVRALKGELAQSPLRFIEYAPDPPSGLAIQSGKSYLFLLGQHEYEGQQRFRQRSWLLLGQPGPVRFGEEEFASSELALQRVEAILRTTKDAVQDRGAITP